MQDPRLVAVCSERAIQTVHYPDGSQVQLLTCLFTGRVAPDELHGSDEGIAWDWLFSPEELPADLLPYARAWLADGAADRSQVTLR
jgi:hypothetical protein